MTREQLWAVYNQVRSVLLMLSLPKEERPPWLALLGEVLDRLNSGEGW